MQQRRREKERKWRDNGGNGANSPGKSKNIEIDRNMIN